MENTKLVDLEMAKSLKEKGYDKPCEYYFLDKDVPYVEKGLKKTKNGELLNHNAYDDFIYSAPSVDEGLEYLIKLNKKFVDKIMFNSFYPLTSAPYIFNWDATEAEEIAKESMRIAERLRNTGGLVVVGGAGKPHLHHELPTSIRFSALLHDTLEARIGDFPKLSEKIIRKNL